MRVAGLPMYDLPEIREATEAWWQGIARAFRRAAVREVPHWLSWQLAPWQLWRHPALLFAQTCGYPLTHGLDGQVRLIATPCHAADGCCGPTYRSRRTQGRRRIWEDSCSSQRLS